MSIVCGTDFSEPSRHALNIAAGMAKRLGDEVLLVHVLEMPTVGHIAGEPIILPLPGWTSASRRSLESRADEALAAEAARLGGDAGVRITPRLEVGEAAAEIVRAAGEVSAPIVVAGSHGRGTAARFVLGSVADRLVRTSPVPSLIVRGDESRLEGWALGEGTLDVLVAIEDGDGLARIAALARLFERAGDVAFHYAHVIELPTMQLYGSSAGGGMVEMQVDPGAGTEDAVRLLARRAHMPPPAGKVHLLFGRAANELSELARRFEPGLMLLGTHGRTGLDRALLGSVAQGVLHRAPCPVAIAPCGGRR